ncbi:Kv channel-interacting protein 4 isoform X1 [Uranotaenia lowii]|uniref:Kv channel-interacting protein 4 isoform X1 n=1 Tax=Uranotaenia lowii TaxID=190385 RepID=UPI0024787B88|nr:Kv channel-interacting protein 4 isoform X1 [Uranotaenia lowii]XP_055607577.1 Kv channel-interacting protein 4 isoform X1 [Uranotaenia lowii]
MTDEQVQRSSSPGFTAIRVEPDDASPCCSSSSVVTIAAREAASVFVSSSVFNNREGNGINNANDSGGGNGRAECSGCRRRKPTAVDQLHLQPLQHRRRRSEEDQKNAPRLEAETADIKSSCLRDCLLCKCCIKSGMEESTATVDSEDNAFENCELEEIVSPPKYRPESIAALCAATRFTEAEIKRIYRGFKAECPAGIIREETFKFIYSQFFPQGANTGLYAHYVFNTLDKEHTGILSFENFVQGLSILSRGSLEEKLSWTFSLYDINHDGKITREEMTDIVTAVYELMGAREDGGSDETLIKSKVEQIFEKMDANHDGVITIEEFLDCCRKDKLISDSMGIFDSAI